LLGHPTLTQIAARHNATSAQVALAWVLCRDDVVAVPRSGDVDHVRANAAALDLQLIDEDLADIDAAFPPPDGPRPPEVL
jgi:diketogulonate reductase-like aldo/keto reductase